MNQLGATARRAFAEIALLQQQDLVAAGSRIDGHSDACRTAAHYDHVPCIRVVRQATRHFCASHETNLNCSMTIGFQIVVQI